MADGSTTQTFNKVTDELENVTGYETVVIENGKRITSKYDLEFEITSTETVIVFSDLKEIEDMTSEFQSAWEAISGDTLYNITELRFATRDDGTILVVSEGSDEIFGRVNNHSNEDTWTDWNGRDVTNTNYSYNFHDGDWNYFGSSGGYSRDVTFEVGDERWDGETATEAVTYADESGTHVNYRVDAPEAGADSTSWDLLNPGTDLLANIKDGDGVALKWSDITEVNIGSNSWSQLDTNGATRDEAFTSSNRQIELFVEHEDGWNEYAGRIEYRSDGFIEIYDSNWTMVARTVDLSNPDNLLKWSDLTDSTSTKYVEGLETSWDEVENYLPSALRDDSTTDADEREDLVFTQNQWGDLNVFSATGDLLVRIDSWEHDGYWESSKWDEEENTRIEGYKYNTGPSFNYNDDDWNQLARTNTQKQYFLSDDVIAASYDGTPPASFAEITSMDHVTISYENGNSGFSANKSDLETVWDGLIKESYDVPAVAASVEGIWEWADITSLFISTDYWKDYDANGVETNSDENKRVEYRAEGFWFESDEEDTGDGGYNRWKFVPKSEHDVSIHGALDQLHTHEGTLGVVEYRDGFIEVRDSNWNTIGRFADAANAEGFDTFADNYEGLEAAWDAVTTYLPSEWGERADLKFAADNNDNILVMDASGILLGRINSWTGEDTWTDWNGRDVTNTNYSYNFHDGDWNYFGSSGGYSRDVTFEVGDERWDGETATEAVTYADESGTHVNYRVDAPEAGADSTSWDLLNPGTDLLANIKDGDGVALKWSDITEVNIGSNSWSQLDTNGATRDEAFTSSNRQIELFVEHEDGWNEYAGRIEYRSDGFIEIYDSNWTMVARTVDLSNPDNLLKWSDLTDSTSTKYVEGLETSWDEVENYLPSALRDDSTTDADEREDLVFTQNQWGDLNVFSATGDLLVRINSWEHDGYWESSQWDEEGNRTEGYKYNTGPSFNYNDDDWNELARTNTQKQYFLSDDVIAASYDGTPPASFAEITSMDHVTISYENGNSGFSANKSDLETVWDGLIKESYDVPAVAASVEGIWEWADITSLFISTDYWKDYDANGVETNSDENKRVEYRAEGFWFESDEEDTGDGGYNRWKFVPKSEHDVSIHGALDQLHTHEGTLGVVEYRDGFIEVRDSNWNTIGRFADAANAEGFDTFADNYEGLEAAWDAVTTYLPSEWGERADLKFAADNNDNILVMDASGILLGRINSWTGEDTWTDWNGRDVTNTNYSYNFHDGDWNYFGSSGGYSRDVTFEVGDERWDGETATEAVTYADESGTHVNYRVDAPEAGADSTSWDLLNPGTDLLANIKDGDGVALKWSDITEVNIGSNSWSQLDTNGATRDEAFTSSNRQIELFVEHEDGWNEYAGRIEYRSDGFIEIYDSNWTMVARTVDLSNPDNLLKWSDLTDSTSTKYVEGLETSWDEVENYLPSALRDDSTTDADEREDLVFTQNQWGDLNVFSATGDLLVRIDSWEHDGYWESSKWDEEENTRIEGYKYNTGPSFNYNDDDWNQLARTNTQKQYFLSDDVIAASYDGTPPASFAEITSMDHVTISYENGNSGFSANKSDLETVWDGLIKESYDVPAVAASVEGIWEWADITSLFISTDYWKDYDANGVETNSDENKRVEYRAEGFWFESDEEDTGDGGYNRWKFVPKSEHDVSIHGALDQLHTHEGTLGVVEYRDGFIEVRDSNWNTIGRFADASNAEDFDTFIKDTEYEDFENAWNAVEDNLPSEWGERADLKFTADSDNNILVMDASGTLLARINVWLHTYVSNKGSTIHQSSSFNFQDDNYQQLANYNTYEREENDLTQYSNANVSTKLDVSDLSDDDIAKFSPISNDNGIAMGSIDHIWTYENNETHYDSLGDATSTNSETRIEYFSSDGQFFAAQEDMGGITYLYNDNWEIVGTSMSAELINPNFLGSNTPDILQNWLDVYEDQLESLSGESGDWSLMQTETGAIALLVDDKVLAVGNTNINESSDEVNWSIWFDDVVEVYGQNAKTDNDEEYSVSEHRVDMSIQLYANDDMFADVFKDFIDTYAPPSDVDLTGTPAEGFNFSDVQSIHYRIKNKDYDGTGEYNNSSEVTFLPHNEMGGSDWENKLSVVSKNGMFSLEDSDWNDIGVSWFDSDIEFSTPDFLGSNTEKILDNWISVHGQTLEEFSDLSGDFSIMQTKTGEIALFLDDVFQGTGDVKIDDPNDNDEVYWDIDFDSLDFSIGGWNGTTDTDGEHDIIRNGVRIDVSYDNDEDEFETLLNQYAPSSNVDLGNTIAEGFNFSGAELIRLSLWENDFNGAGSYRSKTNATFVPGDELGDEDWGNKIVVELRGGIFSLKDADWEDIGVRWLKKVSADTDVSYSDYLVHSNALNTLFGADNSFSTADFELINGDFLGVDFDKNGSTDLYLLGAVEGEDWQQLLNVNTLEQIGGIASNSKYHFARLPSDFNNVKDWVADFQISLESLNIDDANNISAHLSDIMQRNLDVQVSLYKAIGESEWDESIGLSFMDDSNREGKLWIDKKADGSFHITFGTSEIDDIRVPISTDLYTENASLLKAMVVLPQSDLSFDLDVNITSDVAFTDFENDIEIVNDTMEKMFAGEFSYVIEDLYELGMKATEAINVSGNTYVKIASSGDIDHFLIFADNVTTQDVNDAIEDPGGNGETLALLTGLESIEVESGATLASFELNEGSVTITNFDTGVSSNASIVIEASDLFAVGFNGLYTSVISLLYELDPNNKNGDSKLYSELAENAVIDYGLNAFKLYSGDDIVLSTFMENQETSDASTTMLFDNSKVVLDSPYTNISDIMTSLVDIDFDPIYAAETTAANNKSSNEGGITVTNGDIELLKSTFVGADQLKYFDSETFLDAEIATKTDNGFTFMSNDENYVLDVIADPNLPLDDVLEILQSDII